MLGAGYLIGPAMALSIFIGALLSNLVFMPLLGHAYPALSSMDPTLAASWLWSNQLRYLGIGAMLFGGVVTFLKLLRPFIHSIQGTLLSRNDSLRITRQEKDLPASLVLAGILLAATVCFFLFQATFPLQDLHLEAYGTGIVFSAVVYILIFGFLFSIMTSYFSGMVGVTATPGSSIMIASVLFAAWLLLCLMQQVFSTPFTPSQIRAAEAVTIIIGAIVMGIAAIANDNAQDLKVGQLVGATPWRQQVMLLLGVLVSALVIPPIMQILLSVYGIADVLPASGLPGGKTLPAPTAAMMAAITEAVFTSHLPWMQLIMGAGIIVCFLVSNRFTQKAFHKQLSILGIAIGMYLPMTTSFPLFLGGLLAGYIQFSLKKKHALKTMKSQKATEVACGLVAGAALTDVFLAIPFSVFRSADIFKLSYPGSASLALLFAILFTLLLGYWMAKPAKENAKEDLP